MEFTMALRIADGSELIREINEDSGDLGQFILNLKIGIRPWRNAYQIVQ